MNENQIMEEISLRELIEILIKRKKIIALITLVAIFFSVVLSFIILKPTYEAEMILMASNVSENLTSGAINTGNLENMLDALSKYPTMNIETYRQQITTPEVMEKTIKDLNLEGEYTIDSLADKIKLETIKDTNLIRIKMENTDPEKAVAIVNRVGENFIQFVSENIKERATSSSEYVKTQMEKEKEYYEEALLEQKELLSQPRGASELSLELNGKLEKITEYKNQLYDLNIRKSALEAAIKTSEATSSRGSSIILNRESGNILIDDSTKLLKIELAEVQGAIDKINESIETLQDEIEELQVELQEKKHQEDIVNQKVKLARQTYEAFMRKYEELRVTESAEIGESNITVISRAYPPTKPVGPRKALNLAIATTLGLMVGVFTAFFIEYWQATGNKKKVE